jgi:VIT1/CCC1 family predicted Fe2+/Mn2+ transporter
MVPWFVSKGTAATVASVLVGALAAIGIGVALSAFTGRPAVRSALRQLAIAAAAAAVTYAVGNTVGTGALT